MPTPDQARFFLGTAFLLTAFFAAAGGLAALEGFGATALPVALPAAFAPAPDPLAARASVEAAAGALRTFAALAGAAWFPSEEKFQTPSRLRSKVISG